MAQEPNIHRAWHVVQALVFLVGLGLFLLLIFVPEVGIVAFWNVLIPLAPLLFLLVTGVWRNVCPLSTVAMMPHRLRLSKHRRIPVKWQGRLALGSVVLLFTIVPARHLALNNDGLATAATLAFLALLAFVGGLIFDVKSAWCSGLCPVHPVERLYGQRVAYSPPNAHCGACRNCVSPCPDSTTKQPGQQKALPSAQTVATTLLTGGLPGFIWGWFHVPDCRSGSANWVECAKAFGLPWATLLLTLGLYLLLRKILPKGTIPRLTGIFAAASISCYYWYRIPALVGYGIFPKDGLLVDLTGSLPYWGVLAFQGGMVIFLWWWLLVRRAAPSEWAVRPPYFVNRKHGALNNSLIDSPLQASTGDRVGAGRPAEEAAPTQVLVHPF